MSAASRASSLSFESRHEGSRASSHTSTGSAAILRQTPIQRLPGRNASFTGREFLMQQVKTKLRSSNMIALIGDKGIGKSELACEYAYREQNSYDIVRWIDGSKQGLLQSLIILADDLGAETLGFNVDDITDQLRNRLRNVKSYLLIIDNISEYDSLLSMLPPGDGSSIHHIIMTSHATTGLSCVTLNIDVFSVEESIHYLSAELKEVFKENVNRSFGQVLGLDSGPSGNPYAHLAQSNDCHPLALSLATGYIKTTSCTFENYLAAVDKTPIDLINVELGLESYEKTVMKIWLVILESLNKINPKSLLMITWCAFVSSHNIPISLFKSFFGEQLNTATARSVASSRQNGIKGDPRNDSMVMLLMKFGLLSTSCQSSCLQIHPLLQKLILCSVFGTQRISRIPQYDLLNDVFKPLVQCIKEWILDATYSSANVASLRYFLPHLLLLEEQLENHRDPKPVVGSFGNKEILKLLEDLLISHYKMTEGLDDGSSENVCRKLITVTSTLYGGNHLKAGQAHGYLGNSLIKNEKQKEASEELERALALHTKHRGYDDDETATILLKLGLVTQQLKDFNTAKNYFEQCLKITQKNHGENHIKNAEAISNIGLILQCQNRFPEARVQLEKALRIKETTRGQHHSECAEAMHILGQLLRDMKSTTEAKHYFQKALNIFEKVYGKDHIKFVGILNSLGSAMQEENDAQGAMQCYERSLRIREETYGIDHPDSADTLSSLGQTLRDMGEFDEALTNYGKALKIKEKTTGTDNTNYADAVTDLAYANQDAGNDSESKHNFEKAIVIFDRVNGKNHISSVTALRGLGRFYSNRKDFDTAELYYKRILMINEQAYGKSGRQYGDALASLGTVQRVRGHLTGAKDCFTQALRIREETFGRDHISSGILWKSLGVVMKDLRDLPGAKSALEHAFYVYSKHNYPSNHTIMVNITQELQDVLQQMN